MRPNSDVDAMTTIRCLLLYFAPIPGALVAKNQNVFDWLIYPNQVGSAGAGTAAFGLSIDYFQRESVWLTNP